MASDSVQFTINGKTFKVGSGERRSELKLVDFIRDEAKLKGTKYLCREGGCGACVVSVTSINPATALPTTKSVNSCLTPVLSCDGWDISTVEALGDRAHGYHPIQQRLAKLCGTQCGFCTPGMVMTMHSLLDSKKELSVGDVEDALDGNICRCTGYRPILDTFKSFAKDAPPELRAKCADIEECSVSRCCKDQNGTSKVNCCKKALPSDMIKMNVGQSGQRWIKVNSLSSLYDILLSQKQNGLEYRLVAGNTGVGIFKEKEVSPELTSVDISSVAELKRSSYNASGIVLGGGLSITETINSLKAASEYHEDFKYAALIAKHFTQRVGNIHIRNTGTLAGNLMLKHLHAGFASDIFLLFEAVGAQITIGCSKSRKCRVFTLKEFLSQDLNGKVILSIQLQPLESNYIFRSFKISPRYQNSKGYVNAAFLFRVNKSQNFKVVQKPSILFGGLLSSTFIHSEETEEFLNGKSLADTKSLQSALHILEKELRVDEQVLSASSVYRKGLAKSLLYKMILEIVETNCEERTRSGGKDLVRGLRKSKQTYVKDNECKVLYQGVAKLEAAIQCSGEAEYTNDIQPADGELFGAFVLSSVANATLKSIDASPALKMPGVVKFIEAKDVPGLNNYMVWEPNPEPVFVSDKISHAGQPLGLILAESRDIAFAAARQVIVNYENIQKPILAIKESLQKAKEEGQLDSLTVKTYKCSEESSLGGVDAAHWVKGEFQSGGQHHFQMEPHSCVCIPREDRLDVFSSTQWIDKTQALLSSVLNIPVNNINVQVRRLGGGFGGKITRSGHVAAACAVAAHVTHRPVRVILDLETHMRMSGKKLPYQIFYEVGFDDRGKIQRLNTKVYCDPGFSANEETTFYFMSSAQNCYDAESWTVVAGRALTNTPANTFCRGPGHVQGIATIEYIMEHIAFYLKKSPWEVRLANLIHKGNSLISHPSVKYAEENPLPALSEKFKKENDLDARLEFIHGFNKRNRWMKRGLAVVPVRYTNHYVGGKYNIFVAIYHIDGSVVVSHGGIEMGQGMNTKVAQATAETLGISLDKVKVRPTNNLTAANSSLTAAGTTSEACVYGTVEACKILMERMSPVRKEIGDKGWEAVVRECHSRSIDLTANFMTESGKDGLQPYDIWSLIATEVEVDILTGEYNIVRLDFTIDGTKSLNPEVDLGQVEGALIFALGMWTTEKLIYDPVTGQLLTNNAWDYKPPEPKDIPEDFRVTMYTGPPNPYGVLSSKGPGEPASCSSISVLFALKNAITAARIDAGNNDYFQLNGPVTPEDVFLHSLTSSNQFTI